MNKSNKSNKFNKANKLNTLKEVIEELDGVDRMAALYLWDNFDEEDFRYGGDYFTGAIGEGALRKYSVGPLDFFNWSSCSTFNWGRLNFQLKQSDIDTMSKINLDDYTTKDIDYTGCDPVIAEALKQNKSILCRTNCGFEHNIIYYKKSNWPYGDEFGDQYDSAEPIKKTKTEFRVKDAVSIMQYLTDNDWNVNKLGQFVKKDNYKSFDFRDISFCGQLPPEDWQWPELLEEVDVKCESEQTDQRPALDPFADS